MITKIVTRAIPERKRGRDVGPRALLNDFCSLTGSADRGAICAFAYPLVRMKGDFRQSRCRANPSVSKAMVNKRWRDRLRAHGLSNAAGVWSVWRRRRLTEERFSALSLLGRRDLARFP